VVHLVAHFLLNNLCTVPGQTRTIITSHSFVEHVLSLIGTVCHNYGLYSNNGHKRLDVPSDLSACTVGLVMTFILHLHLQLQGGEADLPIPWHPNGPSLILRFDQSELALCRLGSMLQSSPSLKSQTANGSDFIRQIRLVTEGKLFGVWFGSEGQVEAYFFVR